MLNWDFFKKTAGTFSYILYLINGNQPNYYCGKKKHILRDIFNKDDT